MSRFPIGAFTSYNAARLARGRAPIRPSTFKALEEVGIFSRDLEQWAAGSTALHAAKLAKAAEAADYWKSIAPHWGDNDPKSKKPPSGLRSGGGGVPNWPDDYSKSIKVMVVDGKVRVGTNLVPLAIFVEYGNTHMPVYACGARTLEHFGGGAVDPQARLTHSLFIG